MAIAMREEAGKLIATLRRNGSELGSGAGIAQGYATLGQIGFFRTLRLHGHWNSLQPRCPVCAEAKDGQILVSSRIAGSGRSARATRRPRNLELTGLRRPVAAFNVMQSTSAGDGRPSLTVVVSGPDV
jgi:class 3 adenylate cyclase